MDPHSIIFITISMDRTDRMMRRPTFKQITRIASYLLPVILVALALLSPTSDLFRGIGNAALYTLIAVMFLKPLVVLLRNTTLAPPLMSLLAIRRELGIATCWFALFHAGGLIYTMQITTLNDYAGITNYLFWGAVSVIGLVILGLTSNNISVRGLRRNWKRVQWLAYPAFFAALLHVGLRGNGRELPQYLAVAGTYSILKTAEFWKRRKKREAATISSPSTVPETNSNHKDFNS